MATCKGIKCVFWSDDRWCAFKGTPRPSGKACENDYITNKNETQ